MKENAEKAGKNIVMIGMPGVGKSTVGVILAKALGYGFLDTDIIIQTGEGKSLREIIRERGKETFLAVEERYILGVRCDAHVIATGGSAVYREEAMAHLKSHGLIIFLKIGLDALKHRLGDIDARGVTRAPGQTIGGLYAERMPLYERYADITVPCDGLSPDQVMREILHSIENTRETVGSS